MIRVAGIVAYALIFSLWILGNPAIIQAQSGDLSVPLDFNTYVVQQAEMDQTIVLVTLHNRDMLRPIKNVEAQMEAGKSFRQVQKLDNLQVGQSQVIRFYVPTATGDSYLIISYEWNNQTHSLARSITLSASSKTGIVWPTIIPAIISLVGVAIGACLVNFFTSRRERDRTRFEWSRMLFEKYEKAYRNFLNGWGGAPSATLLKKHFDVLEANSFVPFTIIEAYKKTYEVLSDSESSNIQKEEACKRFWQSLDDFIMCQPWSDAVAKR